MKEFDTWTEEEITAIRQYGEHNEETATLKTAMERFVDALPRRSALTLTPTWKEWVRSDVAGQALLDALRAGKGGGAIPEAIATAKALADDDLVLILLDRTRACVAALWGLEVRDFAGYATEAMRRHDTRLGRVDDLDELDRQIRQARSGDFIAKLDNDGGEESETP